MNRPTYDPNRIFSDTVEDAIELLKMDSSFKNFDDAKVTKDPIFNNVWEVILPNQINENHELGTRIIVYIANRDFEQVV